MAGNGRRLNWFSSRTIRSALLAVNLGGLGLALDAFWIEPARLVVNRQMLDVPAWPAPLSGLRVAFLSDLHIGSPHWNLDQLRVLVDRVNAEQPDLIVLGGDFQVNGVKFANHVPIEPIAAGLGRLRAPLGVISVLGNHDWYNGGERVRAALEANGVTVLDGQAKRIDARGVSFCVFGMTDLEVRKVAPNEELAGALPGMPLVAVVHEPDVFAQMDSRAALTLAGHTHGGQVKLPLLGRLIVPSIYGERYVAGSVIEGGRHLFVTTGVGTSIWPVRFGVPPEIALLTLRSGQ